jgi:hypothetical protein
MKYTCALVAMLLFASHNLFAQTGTNQLIGYQEPSTQIKAQAVDAEGNAYYAGDLKGKLVLGNGQEATGRGDQDVFVVKTNSRGEILWYRVYGDASAQGCVDLIYYKGALYLSLMQTGSAVIEGNSITEYVLGKPYSAICKLDTAAGILQWIRTSSLPLTELFAGNDLLVVYGNAASNSGAVLLQSTQIAASSNLHRVLFMYIQTDGQLKGGKTVTSSSGMSGDLCLTPHFAENGSLFFMFVQRSISTSFMLGNLTFSLPTGGNYTFVVKTDTSLMNPAYKLLNPNRERYVLNLFVDLAGYTLSSAGDSLYMILAGNTNENDVFAVDGFNYDIANQSVLLVMDTNLVTRRLEQLNIHSIGSSAYRIRIRQLQFFGDHYYLYGEFKGLNQVQVPGIPDNNQTIPLLTNGLLETVALNGPSKSFLIRCDKNMQQPLIRWLGELTPYQKPSSLPSDFTIVNHQIYFFHKLDNTWNPWLADSSLTIKKGKMKPNADGAESSQFVQYLSDGSRIVMGYAKGKTKYDHPDSVYISDIQKNDLFFIRLSTTGQVIWYKRLTHSFGTLRLQQTAFEKGKLYASASLSFPLNSDNYHFIKFENQLAFIPLINPSTPILFTVDSNGTFQRIPLLPPFNTTRFFDVYENGDLLMSSPVSTVPLQLPPKTFGTEFGFYVARITTQGNIADAVKFYSPGIGSDIIAPLIVQANRGSNGFQLGLLQYFDAAKTTNTIYFSSGFPGPTSITVNSPMLLTVRTPFSLIINANFSSYVAHHLTGPNASISASRVSGTNRHYFLLSRSATNIPLLYDQQELFPGNGLHAQLLVQTDAAGNYVRHKVLSSGNTTPLPLNTVHLRLTGGSLLASGTLLAPQTVDTIQIGHAGNADAVTLQFDTLLQAKRVFRLATPFNENMFGADLFRDSLASFAYTAQQEPTLYNGRSSGSQSGINPADLDENAFLYSVLLNTGIATQVRDLVRVQSLNVYPNPLTGTAVQLQLQDAAAGIRQWRLFRATGELVEQGTLRWQPGAVGNLHFQQKPPAGVYVLVLTEGATGGVQAAKLVVQ